MSNRGIEFVEGWISENVDPEAYAAKGDHSRARALAEQCLADAEAQGISKKVIEDSVGDLTDRMARAMEQSTDAKVTRLAARDD